MKPIIAALPLILLAACQSPDVAHTPVEDQCGASTHQSLVGTLASSLDQATLPQASRVIYPKSAVTMDYRMDRLNVHVGEDGKISEVTCG